MTTMSTAKNMKAASTQKSNAAAPTANPAPPVGARGTRIAAATSGEAAGDGATVDGTTVDGTTGRVCEP
jgi:hypothetical protein